MRAVPYPPELPALFRAWNELKDRCDTLAEGNRELLQALDGEAHLMTDREGLICEGNAALARLLRVAPHRLCGKPLACFVALDERRAFRARLAGVGGRSEQWRLSIRPRDAPSREVEAKVRAGERHLIWRLRETG